MTRQVGIAENSASDQLQKSFPSNATQPLPQPYAPGPVNLAEVGITDPGDSLTFLVCGDVGGVKTPSPQNAVSVAMQQNQEGAAFVLILGDVVYFNGQEALAAGSGQTGYVDQFYEAYAKLLKPIIAFPGNHDGDPLPGDTSLSGFMATSATRSRATRLTTHSSSTAVTPRRCPIASGRSGSRR